MVLYCFHIVDIDEIRHGDIILHNDSVVTVDRIYIKKCSFNGVSIFGDSYNLGRKKVIKIEFKKTGLKNEIKC